MQEGVPRSGEQLRRLLGQLDGGDVVMVTRLDRLARSGAKIPKGNWTSSGIKVFITQKYSN
jgi:hypothetical protein